MAQDLDTKPGQVYDPEEESRRVPETPPDDGLEEMWDPPKPESAVPSLVEKETGATKTGGNQSASSDEEAGLSNSSDESSDENTSGKGRTAKGSKRRNQLALAFGGGIALSLVGLALFIPRIMTDIVVDRLMDTFLGRSKYAIQERVEHYTGKYVTKVIGGELRGDCGGTVNRSCVPSNSLAGRLYESWRTNKIEDKLFTKYGLEFELDRFDPAKIIVKQNGKILGDFGERQVASVVTDSIKTETKFEGIVDRRHVRSVLARKYGANKFCLIACEQRDSAEAKKLNALRRLKLKIIARVSEVGASRTAAYLLCLTVQCSDAELKNSENQIIREIVSKNGDEFIQELAGDIERIKPNSLTELILQRQIEKFLIKVGVKDLTARAAASAVPLAGQVYLAATAIEIFTAMDQKVENREISKYLRDVNAQETALYATQILTLADDNNSGEASIEDSWASFQLLNGFGKSRLAQELNGVEQKSTKECDDGVILGPESPELVCPETKIQPTLAIEEIRNDPTVEFISTLANQYNYCLAEIPLTDACAPPRPRSIIKPTLDAINATLGFIGGTLFSIVGAILPPLQSFMDMVSNFVSEYATTFFSWASEKLLPRFVIPDAEDDVAYEQAAAGLDVTGNQFCRGDAEVPDASSIGCAVVTPLQQAELDKVILAEKKQEMSEKGIFARYFDLENSDSLAGSVGLAVGSEIINTKPKDIAWFNPSNIVKTVLETVGLQEKSTALSIRNQGALFGVTQYAYPAGSTALSIDGETLTTEACTEYERIRMESAFENEETGETDYTETNICALDEVVVDSLTKIYDLDAEGTVSTPGTGTPNTGASAQYIPDCTVNNGNAQIACVAIDTMLGIPYRNGYSTRPGCRVQPSASNDPNPTQLDCSAFTSMAVYRAFGTNAPRSSVAYLTSPLFEVVGDTRNGNSGNIRDIQPGDLVGRGVCASSGQGCNGHIGIVVSYDPATGDLVTAETDSCNLPSRVETGKGLAIDGGGGTYTWAVRYIGPQ
jgi:cell wall-associated NlpC family hydrolase